jgi:hypothetical protein
VRFMMLHSLHHLPSKYSARSPVRDDLLKLWLSLMPWKYPCRRYALQTLIGCFCSY